MPSHHSVEAYTSPLFSLPHPAMPPKLFPNQACMPCKKRKVKCDGSQPRCGLCTRLNKECLFMNDTRKTRTEILEDRLRDLEREVEMAEKGPFRSSVLAHKLWNDPYAQNLLLPTDSTGTTAPTKGPKRPLLMAFYPYSDDAPWRPLVLQNRIDEGERYPSVIPQRTLENMLREWDATTEVPTPLKDILVRVFLPFRHHVNFHIHIHTFLQDVHRPPGDPRSIHPSLLNAIYLFATTLAPSSDLKAYASIFVNRTRHQIQESLAYATKLIHSLWAQSLLSAYYARNGRIAQAYTELGGAIRMAVACGLHRMGSEVPEWNFEGRSPDHRAEAQRVQNLATVSLLPVPEDELEMAERVHLWWALYLADLSMWLIYGQPRNVIDDDVTTKWPECMSRLRQRLGIDPPTLLGEMHPYTIALDTTLTLKVKILNILTKAKRLAFNAKCPPLCPSWHDSYACLAGRLAEFHACLPPCNNRRGLYAIEPKDISNPSLLWITLYACAADMIFHNIFAAEREEEYELVLTAAMEFSQIMRNEMRLGAKYSGGQEVVTPVHAAYVLMGCASIAVEVLAREVRIAAALPDTPSAAIPTARTPTPTRAKNLLRSVSPASSDSSSSHAPSLSASSYSVPSSRSSLDTSSDLDARSKDSTVSRYHGLELTFRDQTKKERVDNAHASLESLLTSLWEFSSFYPSWAGPLRRLRKVFMDVAEYEMI